MINFTANIYLNLFFYTKSSHARVQFFHYMRKTVSEINVRGMLIKQNNSKLALTACTLCGHLLMLSRAVKCAFRGGCMSWYIHSKLAAGCEAVQRTRLLRHGVNCPTQGIYIGCIGCDHVMRLNFIFNYRRVEFANKLQQANVRCVRNTAIFSPSRIMMPSLLHRNCRYGNGNLPRI